MVFDMTGAGEYQEPTTLQTVKCVAYPTKQGATTDVLHLTFNYYNTGDARAEYLNLKALIPKFTKLVNRGKRTVTLDGKGVAYTTSVENGFTYLNIPLAFLEAGEGTTALNVLKNKNASALVAFDVRIDTELQPGQFIIGLGGELTSESERAINPGKPEFLVAQVRKGVTYSLVSNRTTFDGDTLPDFSNLLYYQNEGGVISNNAVLEYPIPAGAVFRGASFMTERLGTIPPRQYERGQSIETLPAGAAGAAVTSVKFHLGNVQGGFGGVARVDLTEVGGSPTSGENAQRLVSEVVIREDAPSTLRAFHTRDNNGGGIHLSVQSTAQFDLQFASRLFVAMLAPAAAHPDDTIDYILAWGNSGVVDNNNVGVDFYLPANTSLVSVEAPSGFTYSSKPPDFFGEGMDPGGSVHFALDAVTNIGKHKAHIGRVRVKVNNDSTLTGITPERCTIAGAHAEKQWAAPTTTIITPKGVTPSGGSLQAINQNSGLTAAAALGEAPTKNIQTKGLLNDAKLLGQDGASLTDADVVFAVAGADYIHTKSGALIIPVGGGNIVAAGGGNIIDASGANLVAGGGGNMVTFVTGLLMYVADVGLLNPAGVAGFANKIANQATIVAAGGGNIVAAGGGNILGQDAASILGQDAASIVAAGGGNALALKVPGSSANPLLGMDGASLQRIVASIVAAGGGNALARTGTASLYSDLRGSIVAAGGGNLIGQDGSSLIGQEGANIVDKLVDNATNTLIAASEMKVQVAAAAAQGADLSRPAGLIPQGGANVTVVTGGDVYTGNSGRIVAAGGGNVLSHNGNAIVAAGGGNIVAAGGGNIVAAGGGNVASPTGPGIVAAGGGN
jgi:uncharacterized repeat protein (TIGR01451 family)